MIALLLALALAQEGEPQDIRVAIGRDVSVNWTTLALEVRASARGGATESSRAVEELARRDADAGVRQGVARIPVSADRTVGDLQLVPEFGSALNARISRWRAAETRYHSTGKVEIDAELSLPDLLRPFTLATAKQAPANEGPQPRYTGVVIDARGTAAQPAWSPRLLSATGEVLYEGAVWEEEAVDAAPVVYVSDPAHPASARAGDDPIFLRVGSASGSDLTLIPEDSVRFKTSMPNARVLGQGRVVVVLDAP